MAESAASQAPAPAAGRPVVIYVMGAGRSGSTILGVTLGNCDGVFYAGELDAWLVRSGVPQVQGEEQLRFWGAVAARVTDASGLFGDEVMRAIDRSLALLRVHKWRSRRRLRPRYRAVSQSLFEAVAQESGCRFIVDTSHYPLRAREMRALNGIDLYLLYLVRDPQSVVGSFDRKDVQQYAKTPLTTNVYLWLTNLLALLVFLRQPAARRMFVRYEDFVAEPEAMLAGILARVGCAAPMPDLSSLRPGVPFQGNRMMRSERISLRRERPTIERGSLATSVLQAPWRLVHALLRPRVRT